MHFDPKSTHCSSIRSWQVNIIIILKFLAQPSDIESLCQTTIMAQGQLLDSILGFELSGHTFELHPYGINSGTLFSSPVMT